VQHQLAEIGAGKDNERRERRSRDLRADRDGELVEPQWNGDRERQQELKSEKWAAPEEHTQADGSAERSRARVGRDEQLDSGAQPLPRRSLYRGWRL